MYFRVYCAHITPIMFNKLSSYNLDELVKPLPFLIESSDEDEACYSAIIAYGMIYFLYHTISE